MFPDSRDRIVCPAAGTVGWCGGYGGTKLGVLGTLQRGSCRRTHWIDTNLSREYKAIFISRLCRRHGPQSNTGNGYERVESC